MPSTKGILVTSDIRLVPAVDRAVAILDLVAERAPLTLSDIARTLALPKSSVHGLCQTLCHLDLLRDTQGQFSMGTRSLRWTRAAADESELISEFHALLPRAPALVGYTITLSSLHGADVVYLACQNSTAPLHVTFRIGMRLPAVFTATGKAMLAHSTPDDRAAVLARPLPSPLTPHSVRTAEMLLTEIEDVRRRGFSIDDGQVRAGMCCLGAAVLNGSGHTVAGVALSMTTTEATPDVIERAGAAIRHFALQISRRAGYPA